MLKIYRAKDLEAGQLRNIPIQADNEVERSVDEILAAVKSEGDEALIRYAARFDRAELKDVLVTDAEIEEAFRAADPAFLAALKRAAKNIEAFHSNQRRAGFTIANPDGTVLGQKFTPLARVGLYIPGGTASYPSSVLMNAIPAKLAGVKEIVMATPPNRTGGVAASILAAARLAGVTKIVKAGGAQAIAALAYGTQSVPAVDKIVGPGNVYVATAKRKVYGRVDIDMIAGPSEILVIADAMSDAKQVAADLLSQAEHDKYSSAVLVTDCEQLALAVRAEVERQLETLPRREIARASIDENGKILLVDTLNEAVDFANRIAPEHLELCVEEPFALLGRVVNAGSVFLGRNAPEALGDYYAGPNHILPTSGTARFSSPLSLDDFVKKTSYIYYTRAALAEAAADIAVLARGEGLEGHARSALSRTEGGVLQ